MSELQSKIAFVTGGSRGIGAAIVRVLRARGADVTFTYRGAEAQAHALAQETGATALRVDANDAAALQAAIQDVAKAKGRLDILINNAGIFELAPLGDTILDVYDRTFTTNVRAVIAGIAAAAPFMGQGGRIVTTGSIAGLSASFPGAAIYAASKAAVKLLSQGFSRELEPKGITVNVVAPGPIDTDMNPASGQLAGMMTQRTSVGRYGRAEEVAALVAFLVGPDAANITGAHYVIDGGTTA